MKQYRQRVFEIIEVGYSSDRISRGYDLVAALAILANLTAELLGTVENIRLQYETILSAVEIVTLAFFAVDYVLRLWTSNILHPNKTPLRALLSYCFSFTGLIDLLCFLPQLLHAFFPGGAIAFRLFRLVRIFRLFRVNAYYDALNVIGEVFKNKSRQLISSVFIILVLMLGASLCMYSLEHDAQPEAFRDAFSGIWWATSTLLTVGYGDIYPITTWGRIFGIIIAFLGVGVVAIPTGIISAGFVEQLSRIKELDAFSREEDVHFLQVILRPDDPWVERTLAELTLPKSLTAAAIVRGESVRTPQQTEKLCAGDVLLLCSDAVKDNLFCEMKEELLIEHHPWIGLSPDQLDISRKTDVLLVKREGRALLPEELTQLCAGDVVLLYTHRQKHTI